MTVEEFFDAILIQQPRIILMCENELQQITAEINGGLPRSPRISEKVTGSPSSQELSGELLKKENAERRLAKERRKLRSMRKRARCMIGQLQDPVQQNIMKERYLWGWSTERIMSVVGYGRSAVFDKQKKALEELSVYFPNT
jgi:hypothetical protein